MLDGVTNAIFFYCNETAGNHLRKIAILEKTSNKFNYDGAILTVIV